MMVKTIGFSSFFFIEYEYENFCITENEYIMYWVQDYDILYTKAAHEVM
jgi:hypothetical protein